MPASLLAHVSDTTPVELVKVKPLTRVRVKKVMVYNSDTAAHRVQIGFSTIKTDGTIDTTTFTQILPDIAVAAGETKVLDVPPAAVSSTKTALRAVTARIEAAAGAPVQVIIEYEEM